MDSHHAASEVGAASSGGSSSPSRTAACSIAGQRQAGMLALASQVAQVLTGAPISRAKGERPPNSSTIALTRGPVVFMAPIVMKIETPWQEGISIFADRAAREGGVSISEMPRPARLAPEKTPTNWLGRRVDQLRHRGKSQRELADLLGLSKAAVSLIGKGDRKVSARELRRLAAYLEWPVARILDELDPDGPREELTIPVVGIVGAGARVLPPGDGYAIDAVEAPPDATETTRAVIVRGDSMLPAYRDGDVIYYDQDRHRPDEHLDRSRRGQRPECVVEVGGGDDRTLIKQLERGSTTGLYTLLSYNAEPIFDVPLKWASVVRWIRRAG